MTVVYHTGTDTDTGPNIDTGIVGNADRMDSTIARSSWQAFPNPSWRAIPATSTAFHNLGGALGLVSGEQYDERDLHLRKRGSLGLYLYIIWRCFCLFVKGTANGGNFLSY